VPFIKGHKLSPGRKKGSKNRSTIASDKIKEIIEAELDQIPEILAKLYDEKRLEMIVKFLPYVAPKLSSQTVSVEAHIEKVVQPKWMNEGDEEVAQLYN
jgi:hypothetical protein